MAKKLAFIGSHLGYAMDRTPLGGGAMVAVQLLRQWAARGDAEVWAVGSGPDVPEGGTYVRLGGVGREGIVNLSERSYARFCRGFEAESTEWLLANRGRLPPSETCVVVNDIAEGPRLADIEAAGYPIVSLWHVDVVDYFNKIYLKQLVEPRRLTGLYERTRALRGALPDVLRLVFEKQRETVVRSRRMVMPSRRMAETVSNCYGRIVSAPLDERMVVVPWGVWPRPDLGDEDIRRAHALRERYGVTPESFVMMTLSRISPEKGLHLLLESLRLLEAAGWARGRDAHVLLCGEPAFMRGAAYARAVHRAAARLKRVKVHFPGYLSGADKAAHFALADLFISPSIHESYGLNVAEAMQAGIAVLASDHYGIRETVTAECGRVVAYPSLRKAPALLATALERLAADRDALRGMGAAARRTAETMRFSDAADKVLDAAIGLLGRP